MNTLFRIVRTTNWKYAVGEISLIFVGITLAFLANSWYENSKDRDEEREVLRQLVISLESDIDAFQTIQARIEEKIQLMKDLEVHVQQNRPYSRDLDAAFRAIQMGGSAARMNTTAFETLTFRGIDLVSSPELRNQLVDYYDTEQNVLDKRNTYNLTDQHDAVPYFRKHFRWESESLLMAPIDYDSLVADQEFLNILALRIWALSTLTRRDYLRIVGKAEQLKIAIQGHLDNLH